MSLKNYYAILGVSRSATPEEIRKAFRAAAKKYHPDKAPDNPFATAHFGEIQEAYEVLSSESRRARYDEECWLRGLYQRREALHITPEWILGEARRLSAHMKTVDTYRMNHRALKDYVLALLSDEHLSILREAPQTRAPLLDELLPGLQSLSIRYAQEAGDRMMLLADSDKVLQRRVTAWMGKRRQEDFWNRYRPLIILLAVLILCLLIWMAGH